MDYAVDLMQTIGPVYAKSMFGGHGIFLDGLMFGLIARGTLYLKTDKALENELEARGLAAFTYNRKGKEFKMSYYQAPEEALENEQVMKLWAGKAYSVALQTVKESPKKK